MNNLQVETPDAIYSFKKKWLFPLAVIARTLGGSTTGRDFDSAANSFTHRVFTQMMALELRLLRKVSLPFGVALFAAARKQAAGRGGGI